MFRAGPADDISQGVVFGEAVQFIRGNERSWHRCLFPIPTLALSLPLFLSRFRRCRTRIFSLFPILRQPRPPPRVLKPGESSKLGRNVPRLTLSLLPCRPFLQLTLSASHAPPGMLPTDARLGGRNEGRENQKIHPKSRHRSVVRERSGFLWGTSLLPSSCLHLSTFTSTSTSFNEGAFGGVGPRHTRHFACLCGCVRLFACV